MDLRIEFPNRQKTAQKRHLHTLLFRLKKTRISISAGEMKIHCLQCLLLFCVFSFSVFLVAEEYAWHPSNPPPSTAQNDSGYTINFENVSILEYIKFASKIANLNFVYDERELNFNVTILSEEPTSLVHVMSALLQVLKINGFGLIEQGNNLIITRSGKVSQIATVVSQESPLEKGDIPPIMTRVFKIKNANPSTVATLLEPLLSTDAILEVATASRHIIVTDITQNIEEIQKLLLTIDAAKSALSVDSYTTRHHSPESLVELANQIILPISEGNPLIFVPQPQTSTVFMVSTPHLIEKSLMIFEDLDSPPSLVKKLTGPLTGKNILIYHLINKPADVLQSAIRQLETTLSEVGPPSESLVDALNTMRYIRGSHALIFTGAPSILAQIRDLLSKLDVSSSPNELEFLKGNFYIYQVKQGNEQELQASLNGFAQHLKTASHPDQNLIETIESMQWMRDSHCLMFTGDQRSLQQIKTILSDLDQSSDRIASNDRFYVYTPKVLSGEAILEQIRDIEEHLREGNLADPAFLQTLSSIKWTPSTHSIIFTGDAQSLDRIRTLLSTIDKIKGPQTQNSALYVYSLKFVSPGYLEQSLERVSQSFPQGSEVKQTIDNANYIPQTHTFVFRGPPSALEELKSILPTLDNQKNAKKASSDQIEYDVYKLKYASGSFVLQELDQTAQALKATDAHEEHLLNAINTITWNKATNALVITGTSDAIEKVKHMIAKYDIETPTEAKASQFYVYRPKTMTAPQYLEHIRASSQELKQGGLSDTAFIQTLQNARLTPDQSAVIFTGTPKTMDRVRELAPTFDASSEGEATHLYVYKPLSMGAQRFRDTMIQMGSDLKKAGLNNPPFIDALESATVSADGVSVVFTGTSDAVAKLEKVVPSMDKKNEVEQANKIFLFTPKHRLPIEIVEAAAEAARELATSSKPNEGLIRALETGKIVAHDRSVLFTGTPEAIARIQQIIPTFDHEKNTTTEFYVYTPTLVSPETLRDHSIEAAEKLEESGLNDPEFLNALQSAKLTPSGDGVTYVGTPDAIERLRQLIPTYDSGTKREKATEFYVYQPKNMTADAFLRRMQETALHLETSTLSDPELIKTLQSAQVTSGGKAVLFTGTPKAIARVKELTLKYDMHQEEGGKATQVFVYTPINMSADELSNHCRVAASHMEQSGLTDQALLSCLAQSKTILQGKSVLFTGTPSAIEEVKNLLPTFDQVQAAQAQPTGATTFLIYKLQHATGLALMNHLRNIANDLERAGSDETQLIQTIQNMRYVKETNSIIFTGKPDILQQAKALAVKFDTGELNAKHQSVRSPSGYLIYKPKYLSGEKLISIVREFQQNLTDSGIQNVPLFETIDHLKWMQQVSSILISGDENERTQVHELLERFDIPEPGVADKETEIEKIADMNFLVYKLQYHPGNTIQEALQKISLDIGASQEDPVKQGLVAAIKSIQWIEVTNSLISTGGSDALGKLEELIKSIDIPLKQVFVEILVVETTIANSLNFGLRWGSQGVYRDKLAYATGSFPQRPAGSAIDPLANFNTNLSSGVGPSNPPTGSMIPFTSGFDLGVIGNIILHKGKSHFTLGSVINALKGDTTSTVALNQKVITQDNKNATIFVGQNIPYTGSVVTNTSSSTVTNSNLEYRDVGVSLSITPQIGDSDTVTLQITEEITQDLSPVDSSTLNNLGGIKTSKTSTQTSVTVPDRAFLIISGQIDNSLTKRKTSIPCLGGIPVIGAAFSQNDSLDNKSCVIIFVRPHIIKSFDIYKEITQAQEDLHRTQTEDIEAFDAGLELVKTPDDF